MSIHDEQHGPSWWNVCHKKIKPLEEKIAVDPTISTISEKCLRNSTFTKFSKWYLFTGNYHHWRQNMARSSVSQHMLNWTHFCL